MRASVDGHMRSEIGVKVKEIHPSPFSFLAIRQWVMLHTNDPVIWKNASLKMQNYAPIQPHVLAGILVSFFVRWLFRLRMKEFVGSQVTSRKNPSMSR